MSRKVAIKLVRLRDACEALSIHRSTFWRQWHNVFTDPRSPAERRPRVARRVYEDELETCIAAGGGANAVAAVLNVRSRLKRK